jgi:16S rRNA (guanine966-N2)-methyltransferase
MRRQIFDVVPSPIQSVLDLFGGSGILGLEALVRGATGLTYVDQDPDACRALRHYVMHVGLEDRVEILCRKISTLVLDKTYDLVFIDPPYYKNLIPVALMLLVRDVALAAGAYIVIKSSRHEKWEAPACFGLIRETQYGDSRLHYYRYLGCDVQTAGPVADVRERE